MFNPEMDIFDPLMAKEIFMHQMDMFSNTKEDYLFSEINKTQNSMNRQFRALFALITEVKKEQICLQEKMDEKKNGNKTL